MCVAIMRTEAGRDPHDRGLQDLVGRALHPQRHLPHASGEPTTSAPTAPARNGSTTPIVGELTLAYEELAITAEPGLILLIYTAEPGSPSAERLRILASLAAEQTHRGATTDDRDHASETNRARR